MPLVKELLAREVDRNIEEVIKVDQDDASIIKGAIEEYVVTDSILDHYIRILERFDQTPPNLAIAHGLEDTFWQEDPNKPGK